MPENNYIGSATSRTNIRTSTTTVYVNVPKLRFFMEPRALSLAPAQSIPVSSSTIAIPKPAPSIYPKDTFGILSQVIYLDEKLEKIHELNEAKGLYQ
ncbi:hypothetical protein QU516_11400 [Moellerella wisconsensis]|uniref:Uncharacterized protein n=1 Tax=Moellerella wisconsensis TaxID=158849 RepID=A0ACD3Y5Z7_9GAMM|nr:hypothetical protein [Moellerella wisconsensis]UNH23505.1 hypothetical protein MNY68_11860 [Moellerella wisconsensis]UNH38223.1 hypothetical protein MNY70_12145 [Moellerella wisconsensis]UNH41731.1 hypothetical protein MNY66_11855 [Moellerella wisconsensis]WJW81239.1 hypothetical protein QU516_11400 [Moellerella wisconsensis]